MGLTKLVEQGYGTHFIKHSWIEKSNELTLIDMELETKTNGLQAYYKAIKVEWIDHICVADLANTILLEFIVDDEGLFKSGNPVYRISLLVNETPYKFDVAGDFLIGKSYCCDKETGDLNFTGFESKDFMYKLLADYLLTVEIIGFVR